MAPPRNILPLFTIILCLFSYHILGYSQALPTWNGTLRQSKKPNTVEENLMKDDDDDDCIAPFDPSVKTISVDDFGAKGDGTDDSQAFEEAWEHVCLSSAEMTLVVPQGKNYLLKPTTFSGPCKSNLRLQIMGTIEASDNPSDFGEDLRHWLKFDGVDNLVVEGGGTINGNGKIWWQKSCKRSASKDCNKHAPTALTFSESKNLLVNNLKIKDAQQMHVRFEQCSFVEASNLVVTAPGDSPNTDGLHVTGTQNIKISSCTIGTGDDCISIVSGSERVAAQDIICGPGHGISVGSLGSGNARAYVSRVSVNGAKISGTANGVRIKTWQGGSGTANNIRFQNIEMANVTNPIIIDQNYCDQDEPCKEQKSAVQIQNVVYENITGTSASDVAINLDCSKTFPCKGIVMQNVDLLRDGEAAAATCENVAPNEMGDVSPNCPCSLSTD